MSKPSAGLRMLLLLLLAGFPGLTAVAAPETNAVFIARAEKAFHDTQARYQAAPDTATNAWQFGCACFDLAEFATNYDRRADLARLGIAACQHLIARDPKSAPGHYYLGMNYGELANALAPSLTAYRLVHQVENEFKTSLALDENFDYGGSSRCLGLLYRDAPGWPLSIGSWHKARDLLERTAKIAPDYPENQLNLAESYLQWGERSEAEKALKKTDAIWNTAKTNLTDVFWDQSWRDWTNRRAAAKAEFQKRFKHAPAS